MKKLLTIIFMSLAIVIAQATEKTVWEGNEAISWNTEVAPGTQYESPEGTFNGLKSGDIIRVYTTTTYDEPQYVLTYKKGDSWEWTDIKTTVSEGILSFTVSDKTMATEIAERGLVIRGQAYTITKIEVVKGYKVTITSPTNGTITVKNGNTDITTGDYVPENTSLTLTAAGTTGYVFDKWTSPTSLSSESASANLSVTEDVTIAADFKSAKTLQTLSTGSKWIVENGGVTIGKAIFANVVAGDILKVAISDVADGATYTLKSAGEGSNTNWSGLGDVTTGDGVFTYTFTAEDITKIQASGLFVTGNGYTCGDIKIETAATINSNATHSNPTLTITPQEHGTISVKNGNDEVASGTKIGEKTSLTLKAEPYAGYEFVSWTSPSSLAEANAETTIEMASSDMTISAQFMAVNEGETEPDASTVDATEIFSTETALGNWEVNDVQMEKTKFTNAIVGDYIKLTISPASTSSQFNLQTMDNSWSNLSEFTTVTTGKTATKYVYQITANALTQLQATGLVIKGQDCTVKKVELLQQKHTLTVEHTEGGSVTVSKGGATTDVRSFEKGASLTFTATPVTGVQFIKWQKDGTDLEETSTTLVTEMTGANMTIKAFFKGVKTLKEATQKMLGEDLDTKVTVAKSAFANATAGDILIINMSETAEGATITLKENGEGTEASYNSITANYDETLTVGQTAYQLTLTGDILANLQEQGLYITGKDFTCGNIALVTNGEVTADAAHVTQYLLTITQPSEGGTIKTGDNDAASKAYTSGTEVSLTATPATNYKFVKWTKDSEDLTETTNPITLTVTANTSIAATFKQMHSVTAVSESDSKGTVAVTDAADDYLYDTGSTITVTATPKSGYEFEKWTKTENASWSSTNNPLNIEDLSADWTLTASFTDATFTAPEGETVLSSESTVVGNWGGTSISNGTYNTYKQDDVIKVYVKAVLENAKVVIQEQQGWSNVTEESIDATTTVYSYTVTASENLAKMNSSGLKITGENYTIWGVTIIPAVIPVKNLSTGSTKINGATSVIIHKERFANASVGDVITIHVSELAPAGENTKAKYGLSGAGENETGDNWGWIEGNDLAENATAITRTITTEDLTILKDAGLKIAGDGIYVCGDVTLTTNGEVPEAQTHGNPSFTLTVNEPVGGAIAIKKDTETVSAGAFDIDTELTLTATASDGYTFLKWQKNGADAGTDATLSITMSANTEITALFQGAPLEYEEKRTLFEGSVDINWDGVAIQPSTVGAILEAGEQLILITTVAEGAYGQVVIRGADRSDAIEGSAIGGLVNGENVITLTSAMVEAMREEFGFWGADATLTKVVLYKPVTVFSEAGVADLTTMTESEGKSTLAVPHNEALKGNVLVVESNENAAVKVTFSDNTTATNKPGDRKIGNPTGSQALVLLDRSKFIKTIEIDKAKAAITKIYMSSLTLFEKSGEDYIADLSLAKAMDNTTFDTSSYTIATTVAWSGGIQLDVLEGETVKGKELMILTESDADLKVTVEYESGDKTEVQDRPASKEMKVVIDGNRAVKQILIQPKTASVTKLLKVAVNASATPDPNVFSKDDKGNFVADLSMVKAEGATYNNTTFTMVATDNWQGVTVTPGNAEVVKGKELYIEFDKAALGYAKISYVDDETSVEGGLDAAGTVMKIALDDSKQISKIEIKLKEAGTAKFKKIAVNATETADESGDDDEEAIIDEKTGEADLNELSAQDDTKTTLTQNEDGSITMTTTEAYQAAQIWFNDPEVVAGNVLKVQLAESSVNVTVTVKYTDGTQSQMSANTMAAKARGAVKAATRADSGTEIEVPLETGKEVQNIEVKNNVAGTITIQKMQVTTINIFTNGVANLSMLKPQSNATYDTSTHTLATTKGWTGATISPVDGETVSGKELLIEFAEAAKVKVAVKYRTDVEGPSIIMEKAAANVRLALDNTKSIQEISIQPTDAAIVTFTKIAVNGEESDDGKLKPGKSITLWENSAGEKLAWNEVAKQGEDIGEMLQEYDELLITVSGVAEDCDWPKVFLRGANSEQVGNEVLLNDVVSFPYTVRIVLTGDMAEQLANGFCVCGDGITVTKLVAYRPEEPKEGDIHLADLNYGYNSSYDKGTHTITTTSRWAARGWEIGDKRYNDKNLIIVKFEPVDFPVTLKMEYTTGVQTAQATSVGVPAGRTELMLEIPLGISKLNRVYLIYEEPGSLRLTEASVVYQDKLKLSTAIQSFEAEGVIRDGRYDTDGWYNLRGMRIQEPKTSGVYIHGGKKVVIY